MMNFSFAYYEEIVRIQLTGKQNPDFKKALFFAVGCIEDQCNL